MKKQILIVVFLFTLLYSSFSQLNAQNKGSVKAENEDFITLDLFSPIYASSRYRVSYIKNLDSNLKVGLDFGYGNDAISIVRPEGDNSIWEVRPELYYIINPNKKTLKYFSAELFYLNHNLILENKTYYPESGNPIRFDKADFNRQKFGLIPKFGMFVNISNRVGLNFYTGLGIRFRINEYSNVVNPEENEFYRSHIKGYKQEGKKIGVEFSFGLKLYYRLKNN